MGFLQDNGAFKLLCHRHVPGTDPTRNDNQTLTLIDEWKGEECIAHLAIGENGSILAFAR
jgi:hypothetical protein